MSWRPDLGLLRLALVVVGGRRFWLLPLLPMLWLLFQAGVLLVGAGEAFTPNSAQGTLIGLPLTLLAAFLGLRIIAGEIDGRSLEIAYTVPGGCERVWWVKLCAAALVLLVSEALLATVTFIFFTPFPWIALYGATQAALFYLVLAMAMATLFRSETAGAMGTAAILGLNGLLSGLARTRYGSRRSGTPRPSPARTRPSSSRGPCRTASASCWRWRQSSGSPSCGPIAGSACWGADRPPRRVGPLGLAAV